jgi:dihydropteroate synthase
LPDAIVEYGLRLVHEGADILDIGGESSRPGAKPVPLREELARTIPVIKRLAKQTKIPISIDTCKPAVAQQALDNGAQIVNDITGLRDPVMRKTVARARCGAVIMHMKGSPRTMQKKPEYECVIKEILGFLDRSIAAAQDDGIRPRSIIVDPGIGFGKTVEQNLEILKNLREFKVLGRPILVGASRKSFIGKILGTQPEERANGSIAAAVLALANGARIIRVHDVKATAQAIRVSEKIIN